MFTAFPRENKNIWETPLFQASIIPGGNSQFPSAFPFSGNYEK